MSQYCITQKRIIKFKLPEGYEPDKIQIGVPVTEDNVNKISLKTVEDTILPSGKHGATCRRNAYGYSYPDKEQEKINRYISTNHIYPFGNKNAQAISVDIYKDCYPRIDVPPMEINLVLFEQDNGQRYIIADLTPDIRSNFLKESVNIFLEIYGMCYIFEEEIKIDNIKRRKRINWELLPPGIKPSEHLFNQFKKQVDKDVSFNLSRQQFIEKYKYIEVVEGINGFQGYYAYIFQKYCVLESAIYGNATYIIPCENWQILSQQTKQELTDANIVINKIIHTTEWENKIKNTFENLNIN